jgi:hypothetical protein
MERIFDVFLFDIKEYGLLSDKTKYRVLDKIRDLLGKYPYGNFERIFSPAGDGYYVAIPSSDSSHLVLLNLAAYLIREMEEVEMRFVITTGPIMIKRDINNRFTFDGKTKIEANRILSDIKAGNIILLSRSFYEKHFGGKEIELIELPDKCKLITHKFVKINDKHNLEHSAFCVSYICNGVPYGLDIDDIVDGRSVIREDLIDHDSFKLILESAHKNSNIEKIIQQESKNPKFSYSYYKVDITDSSREFYLFVKNDSNKLQLIENFLNKNKYVYPLNICSNKKDKSNATNEFWKKDFLSKFSDRLEGKFKKPRFYYIDELIWKRIVPNNLKEKECYSKEIAYISPAYTITGHSGNKVIDVETYIINWIRSYYGPMLIVYGLGGIGKTTLLKIVADNLQNILPEKKLIFFIEGEKLVEKLNKIDTIDQISISTVSDLLKVYYSTLREINDKGVSFIEEQSIDLVLSSGSIIIIIDGLDEIASALKSGFNLNQFLNNIFSIDKLLNNCKIILSTRKYYWENELSKIDGEIKKIFNTLSIEGFKNEMVLEYFEKRFDGDIKKIKEAMELLQSFSKTKLEYYIPFVAYIVYDLVARQEAKIPLKLLSSKYLNAKYEYDAIIMSVCAREQTRKKLKMSIDDFVEFFKEIIFSYKGLMSFNDFDEYISQILSSASENPNSIKVGLLDNLFINKTDTGIKISFDFIQDHLVAALTSYLIINNIKSESIYNKLAKYSDGRSDQLKEIKKRLARHSVGINRSDIILENYIKNILRELDDISNLEKRRSDIEKTISFLTYLAFKVFSNDYYKSKKDRMELLKRIYGKEIRELHIYGDFYKIDFRGIVVRNSSFVNYKNFFGSDFDELTKFIDTKFLEMPTPKKTKKCKLTEFNFDTSCSIPENLRYFLISSSKSKNIYEEALNKDIYNLLKTFYFGGKLIGKKIEHLHFSTSSVIDSKTLIEDLLDLGVITNKFGKEPYCWGINKEFSEAVWHFIFDNYRDIKMESIIDSLFEKYLK